MNWGVWIWSHLSFALLLGQFWAQYARRSKLPPKGAMVGMVLIAAIGMFPYDDSDLAGWLLGFTDHLSIATLMLLFAAILPAFEINIERRRFECTLAYLVWVIGGLWLYPANLGIGEAGDPYLLGYSALMAWIVLALALSLWILRQRLIAMSMGLAVLAWKLHFLDSENLWDYLIDPWLAIFSGFWILRVLFARKPEAICEPGPGSAAQKD